MNKKIIIFFIIAIILLIVGVEFFLEPQAGKFIKILPAERFEFANKKAGYGWSIKSDPEEAVKEAVLMMEEGLNGANPYYVIIWYTIDYNPEDIQSALRELLDSKVQIQGSSSGVGVITPDGYHIGEKGSLAVLGVASPDIKIGVGGADLNELLPREAGREAVREAIFNAGRTGVPQFIYITSAPGREEEILLGVEDIVGKNVPIIGGSSGDETLKGRWSEIANDKVLINGVSLTVFYTNLKIGKFCESGYIKSAKKGFATKAEGRILYEINNKPAAQVYNDWTGGRFATESEKGGNILGKAVFYPLARVIYGGVKEIYLCVSQPVMINVPENSISMFSNVAVGDELQLLNGNWELLINRIQNTAKEAMLSENIFQGEGLFALYNSSEMSLLAIPESERPKIPQLLREELGNISFIGGFTLGEEVFVSGIGNKYANLINSLVIFK